MKETRQSRFLTDCGATSSDAPYLHMLNLIADGIRASLEFCRRLGSISCI